MAQLKFGPRIAQGAPLRIGCSAIVLDAERRVLLTRRVDNGRWCLPGGGIDSGESVAAACEREVWEETGLRVRVTKLVGVYSSPDMEVSYADGNRYQLIALSFAVEVIGGTPQISSETTQVGFFTPAEIETLDLMEHHYERLRDYFAGRAEAIIR